MNVHLPIDEPSERNYQLHDRRYELVMTFADLDEAVAILLACSGRRR